YDPGGRCSGREHPTLLRERDPEVDNLDLIFVAVPADNDVLGLDVSMNDLLTMRLTQAGACLLGDFGHEIERQGDGLPVAGLLIDQHFSQALTIDILDDHKRPAIFQLSGVEDLRNVGMVQALLSLHLSYKPQPLFLPQMRPDNLDHRSAFEHPVRAPREIELGHTAAAQLVDD